MELLPRVLYTLAILGIYIPSIFCELRCTGMEKNTYRCESSKYCCSSGCCTKNYDGWYLGIPIGVIVVSCCILQYLRLCKNKYRNHSNNVHPISTKDKRLRRRRHPSQWRKQELVEVKPIESYVKSNMIKNYVSANTNCEAKGETYTCASHQHCCDGFCCDEIYAVWYVWVLLFGLLLLCCFAAFIIRKKKQRKNRITHSMFLERLRERIEQQIIDEAENQRGVMPLDGENILNYGRPIVTYTTQNEAIGIGGMRSQHNFMLTPIEHSGTPVHLFEARAPPPYRETETPTPGREPDNTTTPSNEAPPSYDSIFS